MSKDESITISGGRTESVSKDEGITITGGRTVSVGKDDQLTVGKNLDDQCRRLDLDHDRRAPASR